MEQRLSLGPFISIRPCLIQGLKGDSEAQSRGRGLGTERGFYPCIVLTQRRGIISLRWRFSVHKSHIDYVHVFVCLWLHRGEEEVTEY